MKKIAMNTLPTALTALGAAICALLLASTALAVGPDAPFTPPPTLGPQAHAAPSAVAADSAASAADADTPPAGLVGLRLGAAPSALIDGQWVRVGQETRGARLVEVRPNAVRLRHANGQIETLALFSDPKAAALTPRRTVASPPVALRELP